MTRPGAWQAKTFGTDDFCPPSVASCATPGTLTAINPADVPDELNQFSGTTDAPSYWRKIFGHPLGQPERYLANSPSQHVGQISTPMLVIHGDKDYRVPVGEALRLWYDLQYQAKDVKYLYFPDENHWILKPANMQLWNETVLAWLDEWMKK